MVHFKCRSLKYLNTDVTRILLKDSEVNWSVPLPDYKPTVFNSPVLSNKPWADPDIKNPNFKPIWNKLDGMVNRQSHTGDYKINKRYPLNPAGRTGLAGRGILGKWGPNHAADPIVSRWKRNNNQKVLDSNSNLPILQICVIQRRDCKEWALPGGMVDAGENISATLKREFMEEAMNSLQNDTADQKILIDQFFQHGHVLYKGYVDDPRNTDNAWIETVAVNFHDENNSCVGKLQLQAGDDAQNVKWVDATEQLKLYASHSDFVKSAVQLRNAHW